MFDTTVGHLTLWKMKNVPTTQTVAHVSLPQVPLLMLLSVLGGHCPLGLVLVIIASIILSLPRYF
jgi:ABC-type dipeptide/oligopeptide/nickel transport system permease subunit